MYLPMCYLTMLWALMPLGSIAFPTSSSGLETSKTYLDRIFGRDEAHHIAHVRRANPPVVLASIDPTDNTPIYAFSSSTLQSSNSIFGNLTSPALGGPDQSIINFKFGLGPVIIDGRIDTDTLDTDITVWIYGLKLGEFHGNLVNGVSININLHFVQGEIVIYLKNKVEVWLHLELRFSFGSHISKDVKILVLPEMQDPKVSQGAPLKSINTLTGATMSS